MGMGNNMKKILIISGTPKTEGITYSFVRAAEETSKEIGLEYETIALHKENLQKCKLCKDGWGICFGEHICQFDDNFNIIQEKVKETDAFIYISPVYWGEISEDMKIFLDKLRRCQATKQWDKREEEVSFHKAKPSILVAVAGGGGGGILTALQEIERAISQMSGDSWPRYKAGINDFIAVNRWNKDYKLESLKSAIIAMKKNANIDPSNM